MADVDFQSSLGWEIILNCVCVLMFDIKICFCKGSNAAAALHLSMNQACNWWQKGGSPRASKHRTVRDVNLCFLFTARLRLAKRNQLYEAWTPAGSWGERRSSLLALRTCLSEKSVQIFLDVYYIYIHHHPPFFFVFLLYPSSGTSVKSGKFQPINVTWPYPGIRPEAQSQFSYINVLYIYYSGDIRWHFNNTSCSRTDLQDRPSLYLVVLSCRARPTGLSCDVRGQHLLVRDLGHPGTKIFQEFPAADHAVLLLCGFQGYWWLVHLLCLCERGGRWLYSRAACCKRPRVSTFYIFHHFSTFCLELLRFQLKAKILEWGSCNFLHLLSKDVKFRLNSVLSTRFERLSCSKAFEKRLCCNLHQATPQSRQLAQCKFPTGSRGYDGGLWEVKPECKTKNAHGYKMLTRWWPLVEKQTFEHLKHT